MPSGQRGAIDLTDARGGDGLLIEGGEELLHGVPELFLDARPDVLPGQRGHIVLQLRELFGEVRRHEVAARGEDLAGLDEGRAEPLERMADAHGARKLLLFDAGVAFATRRLGRRMLVQPAALEDVEHTLVPQHGGDLPVPRAPPRAAAKRGLVVLAAHEPSPRRRQAAGVRTTILAVYSPGGGKLPAGEGRGLPGNGADSPVHAAGSGRRRSTFTQVILR